MRWTYRRSASCALQQPYKTTNAACWKFGPDGLLYIGTGDGGFANDPSTNAQTAKPISENPGASRDKPTVGIPGQPVYRGQHVLPRNLRLRPPQPWRFSFDRATGQLYCADVGQDKWEEINIIEKGATTAGASRKGWISCTPVPKPPDDRSDLSVRT